VVTRFYLPSSGAAAVSPSPDAEWDATGSADYLQCVTTPSSTSPAEKAVAEAVTTNNYDVLLRSYVSEPLSAQSISGTVKGQILCRESSSSANFRSQLVVKVVSNDGTTVRGTLLAADTGTTVSDEWNTGSSTWENRKIPLGWSGSGASLSSVSAQDGDRLVFEIGYRAHNTSSSSFTGGIYCNDTAGDTDLSEGGSETDTAASPDYRSWIELSQTLTFQGAGTQTISASGIASGEAFGSPAVSASNTISAQGIASTEAFGGATVTPGAVTISAQGVASTEAFGSATVTIDGGTQTINAQGIASTEAFGSATVTPGAVTVSAAGIASGEAFGSPAVSASNTISAQGIASTEAFGGATVTPGPVTISAQGVASTEAFGSATIFIPTGIDPEGAFHVPPLPPYTVPALVPYEVPPSAARRNL
jgi:hypothetical protein